MLFSVFVNQENQNQRASVTPFTQRVIYPPHWFTSGFICGSETPDLWLKHTMEANVLS